MMAQNPESPPAQKNRGGGEPLITLRGVTKNFGGRAALQAVDLSVHGGETVTLIGPNGAGKTTLVRLALGLAAPDAGAVWRRPGLKIGYMPQKLLVDDALPLDVRHFLALGRPRDPARMMDVLDEVGAADLIDAPIQRVSGGEMQRVLLARALLREPDLLVLDEPVQGVDVGGQAELYALIAAVRDRHGCGVLMVSHDLHLVMASSNRVVCLNHHVCCSGAPVSVANDPQYRALFGLPAGKEVALYQHYHDHHHDMRGHIHPDHPLAGPLPPGGRAKDSA